MFYRFPVNLELRQCWISALRRENFVPSKTAVVCSSHFLDQDFEQSSRSGCRRLRADAVPSVFPAFPSRLQRKPLVRKAPADRSMAALTSSSAPQSSSVAALTSADKLSATSSSTAAVASDCQLSSTTTVKPIWILLKQETASGSGISWATRDVRTADTSTDGRRSAAIFATVELTSRHTPCFTC